MACRYIGLISGTSVDGIDAVLAEIDEQQAVALATLHVDIPAELKSRLLAFNAPAANELDHYADCDVRLGHLFAHSVQRLLENTSYSANDITAIGSHGQTIRHYPGGTTPTTLQIGDPNIIAECTGITTVADFRRRDMAAGGQGAPLVPAFHAAMFRLPGEARAVLNLGGIANLTLLAADPRQAVLGFDTGPANCLLNDWIQQCRQQEYDDAGQWAAQGEVHQALLEACLNDPYFALPAPKSTGRDYFRLSWLEQKLHAFSDIRAVDVQATLAELTARSVANDLLRYAPATTHLFVCGGGVHNLELGRRLQACLPDVTLASTASLGIDPDYVEAMAFAWLARKTLNHETVSLSSVTGARQDRILGGIYPA
ncbi:MAG: anhydro-N-acetylmuramic acid kinase [Gammaproteobacteria bacterium]